MPSPVHPLEFKQKVVDMRYEKGGMSSREIARYLNDEYKERTGRDMTRGVVVGIWDRNPHLIRKEYLDELVSIKEYLAAIEENSIVKQYESLNKKYKKLYEILNERYNKQCESLYKKHNKKFRVRTCLSCGKKAVLEKQMFMCDPCKRKKVKSMSGGMDEYIYHG